MTYSGYSRPDRVAGFALLILVLSGVAFYSLVVFWPLPEVDSPVTIKVKKGASLKEIGDDLQAKNVITDSETFVIATRMMGHETTIRAGVFALSDLRSNYHIVQQLVNGTPILRKITIPEGMKKEQVAAIFQDKLEIDEETFISLCKDVDFIKSLGIEGSSLEGFLFPDTYQFFEGESTERIIETMVSQYQKLFKEELGHRLEVYGLTELEMVTLASIIEGEAIYDSERPLISSVYHNRLNIKMRLQADPTIQYIINDGPRRLLKRDLKIESPYNTYLNYGLPPGPINSPGLESLRAAVSPADADFLFFVANGEGYHTFSRTEAEHNVAKKKLQRHRRKVKRQQAEAARKG
ncbi:MAG: aminodeoxychorismate lyase [Candidatus Marinimicrobia bacterium]|nr:aminodeoxychorismate lyase [Candidatus Neomarinimicrobiota bacterium]|tara:strand:+ start:404 stop:1456 length:1053 start_codon:yes stop_codon:yes gene_type:complete